MSTKPPVVDPTLGTYKTKAIIKGVGPIPTPLEFWFIFVGSRWETTDETDRLDIEAGIRILFDTNMFDSFIQYPYLKRPTLGGIVRLPDHEMPSNYSDIDLRNIAATAAAEGLVPWNDTAPPGVTYAHYIIPPANSHSDTDAGGYHFNDVITRSNGTKYNMIGAVNITDIMYTGFEGFTHVGIHTDVITHEMEEMITDPLPFPKGLTGGVVYTGWHADPNGILKKYIADFGGEIADVCLDQASPALVAGVVVAAYWSDKDGKCIAPTVKPNYTTCPSGYTWNDSIQRCINLTNPPPIDASDQPPGSGDTATSDGIPPNPILATKQTHFVGFGGGPIYKPLEIYIIFAGSTFGATGSDVTTHNKLIADLPALFESPFFDNLIQYGLMPRPKLMGVVVNSSALYPTLINGFTRTDLLTFIGHSQDLGLVPANSTATGSIKQNIAYLVITKPGVVSDQGIQYNDADPLFGSTYNIFSTAVVNATDYTITTTTISKALIDMVANPIPYLGYSMIATTPGYSSTTRDIGTICSATKTIAGITVVNYWSDQDGACISSSTSSPPWITCKAGYAWNPATHTCDVFVPPPPTPTPTPPPGGGGTGGGSGTGGGGSGGSGGHSGGGASGPPDPPINTGNELHDLCAGTIESKGYLTVGGTDEERVAVVSYYSDEDGTCLVPNSKPTWITCPSGSAWDNELQECVIDSSKSSDDTQGDSDTGSGPGSGAGGSGDVGETPPLVSYTRDWTFRLDVGVNSDDACTIGNPFEVRDPVAIYDVPPGTSVKSFENMGFAFGNGITEIGLYITSTDSILYNRVIKRVDVKAIRRIIDENDTGPIGFISCYIMSFANKQIQTYLDLSQNVAGMDINEQTLTFEAPNNDYPLKVGDMIILWYWDSSATTDRCLRIRRSDQNYIDGVNSFLVVRTSNGYFSNPDADPAFTLYI